MKTKNDRHTIELPMPGAKGVPGRPRKPDALSDAERAKRYRARRRALGLATPQVEALKGQIQLTSFQVNAVGDAAHDAQRQLSDLEDLNAFLRHQRDELQKQLDAATTEIQRLKAQLARRR